MSEVDLWRKKISPSRDRFQASLLVWTMGTLLTTTSIAFFVFKTDQAYGQLALRAGLVSLCFALIVWVLRAGTPMAAFCGGMVCFLVISSTEGVQAWPEVHSGLTPLMTLFLLTYLSTQAGKSRKARAGLAESRRGRNAAQVIANLGAAGLVAALAASPAAIPPVFGPFATHLGVSAMLLGVLAEATADTVSSEIGQGFGGAPFLLTTFRRVEPGTDGAISLLGTAAGICGAALIVLAGAWAMALPRHMALAGLYGGVAGLFFDSILGVTVERRGWFGNDLVNFSSTVFAGLVALAFANS